MNTKLIALGALSGLTLAGGVAGMVSAQSVADATLLTEEQVIEIALAEVAGEVSDIELAREDGQQVYEIEITAADGAEYEVEIIAASGEILEVAEDDKDCDDEGEDDDGEDA